MTMTALRASVLLLVLAAVPAASFAGEPPAATAPSRFAALDVNGDGVLSRYEYDGDSVLVAIDSDHNSRVSPAELQAFLGPEEDGAPSATYRISVVDRNNDGELSDEELRRGTEIRFQWLDRNKDGNVDLAELKEGFGVPMVR